MYSQLFCLGPFGGTLRQGLAQLWRPGVWFVRGRWTRHAVLFKENPSFKDTLRLIGLLLAISIVSGIIIQITGFL